MRVALLRHPTPAVARGLCYGRLDVRLAAVAADETLRMIARLAGWQGAAVWSSPRQRCLLPARAIARALCAPAPQVDARLQELDFGAWEGRPWAAVERAALDEWAARPADFTPPGGEAVRSLVTRVGAFWSELPVGAHIIVTHGGPLKVFAALARGEAVDLLRPTMAYAAVDIVVAPVMAEPGQLPAR
jgi:alpha-ribazole phosphatase